MGFIRQAGRSAAASLAAPRVVSTTFSLGGTYPWDQRLLSGTIAPKCTRAEALQVPAVLRGRNLIAGTLSTLPLRTYDQDHRVTRSPLLEQIDPNVPNCVTLAQTIEDLIFESVSWWQVTRYAADGFPLEASHVDQTAVSMSPPPGFPIHTLPSGLFPGGLVWVAGRPVDARDMKRFDSPNPPLLTHAARAIRRALKLEQAADKYADEPQQRGYFTPKEGTDPANDDDIKTMLNDWEAARRAGVTGYVPAAVDYNASQWSPADIQLAEVILKATLAIVNAMGLDPEDFGINVTSRTYQNAVDRRQDKINETFGPYVSAIQDRLSMGDVTPRGKYVRFYLDDFLKADPKTRWETYSIAKAIGGITTEEIRDEENRPPLPELAPAPAPALPPNVIPMPASPATEEAMMRSAAQLNAALTFTAAAPATLGFDDQTADTQFRVDVDKRTISGLIVPFGPTAVAKFQRWRFAPGSLTWGNDLSRIKLLRDHDPAQALGRAVRIQQFEHGVDATFKVAHGPEGDRILALAADRVVDGLSVGIDTDDPGARFGPDPTDPGVQLITNVPLREVTITAMPSFDGARVANVTAQKEGLTAMTTPTVTAPAPAAPADPAAAPAAPAAPAPGGAPQFANPDLAAFTAGVSQALVAAIAQGFAQLQTPTAGAAGAGPTPVIPRAAVTYEPPVYTLVQSHAAHSFVRDAWRARGSNQGREGDEARARLAKFMAQQADISQRANDAGLQHFRDAGELLRFTTGSTSNLGQIIPPGYRPELYVPQLFQGRPLGDALSQGQISDPTPFTVPKFLTGTGLGQAHTEGVNPSDGTITMGTVTVTPGAKDGLFKVTREIVDASNPAIDAIALQAMREAYSQVTEAVVYAELNGANGVGGTITAGFVPSGAAAVTATGTGNAAAGRALLQAYRAAAAAYPFRRFAPLNRIVLSQEGTVGFAAAEDTAGRPLLPYLNPQNAVGTVGGLGGPGQGFNVDGIAGYPAWSMTGNAAGDADLIFFNSADAWVWESPTLTFRYEERSGPALIELALFGYFACRILRASGFTGIRLTVT